MKIFQKILLFIMILGGIIWIGGVFIRVNMAYLLLEPGKILKFIDSDISLIYQGVKFYTATSVYTNFSLIISFLISVYFFILFKKDFRKKGWLLISYLLFYISFPLFYFHIYHDYTLSKLIYLYPSDDLAYINSVFLKYWQNNKNTSFLGIAFFMQVSALLFLVIRPLEKNE